MSQYQSTSGSDPPPISRFPQRPDWNTKGIDQPQSVSALEAATEITTEWHKWADKTERAFQNLHNHSKILDVTDEVYIGFIGMISHHPARPEITPWGSFENSPESMDVDFPRIPFFELHMTWEAYADVLEETYTKIASELSRHKLDWGKINLGLSKMSLTADASTESAVSQILANMLGPERSFHTASSNVVGQPASFSMSARVQHKMRVKREEQKSDSLRQCSVDQNVQDIQIQNLSIEDQEMEDCDTF